MVAALHVAAGTHLHVMEVTDLGISAVADLLGGAASFQWHSPAWAERAAASRDSLGLEAARRRAGRVCLPHDRLLDAAVSLVVVICTYNAGSVCDRLWANQARQSLPPRTHLLSQLGDAEH